MIYFQKGKYEWSGLRDTGDCSLRILKSNIVYDDGDWECQVTKSSHQSDDGLRSAAAKLVVRQPPGPPTIFHDHDFVSSTSISLTADQPSTLRCESRGGNPAPQLVWFVDNKEMPSHLERNETEPDNEKRWTVISSLHHQFSRTDNGKHS